MRFLTERCPSADTRVPPLPFATLFGEYVPPPTVDVPVLFFFVLILPTVRPPSHIGFHLWPVVDGSFDL